MVQCRVKRQFSLSTKSSFHAFFIVPPGHPGIGFGPAGLRRLGISQNFSAKLRTEFIISKSILPKATKITAWLEKLRRISLLFPRNRNPDKYSSVQPLKERSPVSPLYFSINIYLIQRLFFFSVNGFISIFSRAKIILGIQEHHPFLSDIFSLLKISPFSDKFVRYFQDSKKEMTSMGN